MLALLSNEWVLGGIIIVLVFSIVIAKFVGFKKFFGIFARSGERVEAAKAKAATAKAETTKAKSSKATAAEATD